MGGDEGYIAHIENLRTDREFLSPSPPDFV